MIACDNETESGFDKCPNEAEYTFKHKDKNVNLCKECLFSVLAGNYGYSLMIASHQYVRIDD